MRRLCCVVVCVCCSWSRSISLLPTLTDPSPLPPPRAPCFVFFFRLIDTSAKPDLWASAAIKKLKEAKGIFTSAQKLSNTLGKDYLKHKDYIDAQRKSRCVTVNERAVRVLQR